MVFVGARKNELKVLKASYYRLDFDFVNKIPIFSDPPLFKPPSRASTDKPPKPLLTCFTVPLCCVAKITTTNSSNNNNIKAIVVNHQIVTAIESLW